MCNVFMEIVTEITCYILRLGWLNIYAYMVFQSGNIIAFMFCGADVIVGTVEHENLL